jgi:8-oxo-dGTP pyrophosphatase MutT (NUDIX family)
MIKQSSAGVVVYRVSSGGERTYLLLQYPRGPWDFAKGKLRDGEGWREAALRELKEETGLALPLHKNFEHCYSYTFNDARGNKIEKTILFFIAQAPYDCEISLSQEHVDYLWLPYEHARMQLVFENIKHLLDQVEQFLELSDVQKITK